VGVSLATSFLLPLFSARISCRCKSNQIQLFLMTLQMSHSSFSPRHQDLQ
jgi:hypothetical protein